MKKFLFSMIALMLVFCVSAFAQVDSTAVSNVTTSVITLLFDNFGKLISNNVWTVVFFVAFILPMSDLMFHNQTHSPQQ